MKPEEILEKVANGELSGETLDAEIEKLDLAGQAELKKLSKEAAAKELSEVSAFRKAKNSEREKAEKAEREAQEAAKKAEEAKNAAQPSEVRDDTMQQFRSEQKQKAIARVKSELGLSDEDVATVVQHFDKIDSGFVDADNIYNELKGAYAFIHRDTLLEAGLEKRRREEEAARLEAEAAGGAGGAPQGGQPPQFSDTVKKIAKDAGIAPEAAKKIAEEGHQRVYG